MGQNNLNQFEETDSGILVPRGTAPKVPEQQDAPKEPESPAKEEEDKPEEQEPEREPKPKMQMKRVTAQVKMSTQPAKKIHKVDASQVKLPEIEEIQPEDLEPEPNKTEDNDESFDDKLERLLASDNLDNKLVEEIDRVYHTHAVTPSDIAMRATDEQLNLEKYKDKRVSIIMQIGEPWVKDIVDEVLSQWSSSSIANSYVEDYLKHLGAKPEDYPKEKQKLLDIMKSTTYKNDAAPDLYKMCKAVQIIQRQDDPDGVNLRGSILGDPVGAVEYAAVLQSDLDSGLPCGIAEIRATKAAVAAIQHMNKTANKTEAEDEAEDEQVEESKQPRPSAAQRAGNLYGKVVTLPRKLYDDAMDGIIEKAGPYAPMLQSKRDAIEARRNAVNEYKTQRKQDLALHKQQVKYDLKEQKAQDKLAIQHQRTMENEQFKAQKRNAKMQQKLQRQSQPRNGFGPRMGGYGGGYGGYGGGYCGGYGGNGRMHGKLPMPIICIIINIVVAVLTFVIGGALPGFLGFIGMFISTAGWVRVQGNEPGGIFVAIGGYIVYAIVMFMTLMR